MWGIFVGTLFLVLASVEAAYRLARRRQKEVALDTPEAHRSEIRAVLREYVEERLRWASGQPTEPGKSASELRDRLWKAAAAVAMQTPGAVDVFLGYVAEVIELQDKRLMVRERSRIPGTYWAVLYLVAVLALAAMGYHVGVAGTHRSPALLAVAIAFSAVMLVIADLDRPGQGLINVSQEPMLDLRAALADSKRWYSACPVCRGERARGLSFAPCTRSSSG